MAVMMVIALVVVIIVRHYAKQIYCAEADAAFCADLIGERADLGGAATQDYAFHAVEMVEPYHRDGAYQIVVRVLHLGKSYRQ